MKSGVFSFVAEICFVAGTKIVLHSVRLHIYYLETNDSWHPSWLMLGIKLNFPVETFNELRFSARFCVGIPVNRSRLFLERIGRIR